MLKKANIIMNEPEFYEKIIPADLKEGESRSI